ncbi:Hypothetical protein, putative [Bodo saltans]|uniref:Uncharacterized protein n=1 Tax=Bodo saltans TaxID=75058 RepID=A0A0S4J5H7_BODSA|nr:Hypothetical protein, putative [Bodo saltans]|eukprot:CUG86423.1 Hypothetical protein, putative [Bodo saltans]
MGSSCTREHRDASSSDGTDGRRFQHQRASLASSLHKHLKQQRPSASGNNSGNHRIVLPRGSTPHYFEAERHSLEVMVEEVKSPLQPMASAVPIPKSILITSTSVVDKMIQPLSLSASAVSTGSTNQLPLRTLGSRSSARALSDSGGNSNVSLTMASATAVPLATFFEAMESFEDNDEDGMGLDDEETGGNPLVLPLASMNPPKRECDLMTMHGGNTTDMFSSDDDEGGGGQRVVGVELVTPSPAAVRSGDERIPIRCKRSAAGSSTIHYGPGGSALSSSHERSARCHALLAETSSSSHATYNMECSSASHAEEEHMSAIDPTPVSITTSVGSRKVHFRPHAIVLLDDTNPSTWMIAAAGSSSAGLQNASATSLASLSDELGIEPGTPHRLVPLRSGSGVPLAPVSARDVTSKPQNGTHFYRFL